MPRTFCVYSLKIRKRTSYVLRSGKSQYNLIYSFIHKSQLTRRIYNIEEEDENFKKEVEETIENFTIQLKTSGWDQRESSEIMKR